MKSNYAITKYNHSGIIKKIIIGTSIILIILIILLGVGLADENYFNWFIQINYNPKIV